MKKINFPLSIGIILLTILLLISFFPEKFTKKDPNFEQRIRTYTVIENGKEVSKVDLGFWGPNKDNIMGVDEFNRDIYSRIIYGTKTTLKTALMIVLLRLLIAIPIGIIAGIGSKFISSVIRFFNTVFTAIPTLFIAFFILNIDYITELQLKESIIAFAIVLTALGWGKLARQVEERVGKIMREEFIEGEKAIGKSIYQITLQNMIPHLIPSLISLMFIEVGMVIFLLAQLSILEVFVGPRASLIRWGGAKPVLSSINPEWGATLSRILVHNRTGKYWIGLYPSLAFAIGILAFNLTGEGLRIEFEKRTSRVASSIRNIGFLISPRIYFQQIKRYKEYRRPVIIKSLCIVILLVYIFMPAATSLYPFQAELALAHMEELVDPKYEGRVTGFEGSFMAGNYIVEKLKEYGLEPYDGDNYFQSFPVDGESLSNVFVEEAEMILTSKTGEMHLYDLNDFNINSINKNDLLSNKYNEDGSFELKLLAKPSGYDNYIVNQEGIDHVVEVEFEEYYFMVTERAKGRYGRYNNGNGSGVFIIGVDDMPKDNATYVNEYYTISVSDELAKKLSEDVYEVLFKINKLKLPEYKARNILAVLPGKDWDEPDRLDNKKEVIIIGAQYDGAGIIEGNTSAITASSAAINLEIARVISQMEVQLDKTIVFAFWDGESTMNSGSYYYNIHDRIYQQNLYKIFYFDIGTAGKTEEMIINIYTVPHFQMEIYDMKNEIEKWLNKKKVKYKVEKAYNSTYNNIGDNMILKLSVTSYGSHYYGTMDDTPENINKTVLTNMGQYYIDLITMDENFK